MRVARWSLVLLCAACTARTPVTVHGRPRPVVEDPAITAPVVWMDCSADRDCAARPGTLCHTEVHGGTCAPACADEQFCTGVDPALRCVAGRCGALDAGVAVTSP